MLGRCAALLFLCGAVASLPTNALLNADADAYAVNALAFVSTVVTLVIPWQRLHRRWMHVLVLRMYAAKRASRDVPFVLAMDSASPSARDRHLAHSPASGRRPS